ncbi:hypothetical protein [Staphylococcus canis]|uniref:Phage protein n=1 Tax=Staphylococcus canis TaxID=2724942 RepID=A0ABS0T935_9STAP|nr:hypothetical protein [Staphylococcus canis]MBI5975228.1 hypothetical protein [Staphylococcus canis]
MEDQKVREDLNSLVNRLIKQIPDYFKFHGDTATELFLSDELKLNIPVDICIRRNHMYELVKTIGTHFDIFMINENDEVQVYSHELANAIKALIVEKNGVRIMNIVIYDVDQDDWLFRLNHDIRMPEKQIFLHSTTWGVDYIKPEILLMYALKKPINPKNIEFYRLLIDKMSYFQYVILKTVVGEENLNQIVN